MLKDTKNPIDEIMKQMFGASFPKVNVNGEFVLKVNSLETENAFHIEMDVPGIKKEDISIDIDQNIIKITAEKKMKEERKEEDFFHLESKYGKYTREFNIPQNIDQENIHAETTDGVLSITLPKLNKESKKKVEVK